MEEANDVVAGFVAKTYQMVTDPTTAAFITWGKANNTFIVLDPFHFSNTILPVYFNHNNFSSFIRQLNTYGFKKVDPDKWEFANEWFLREQNHLLKNIVRKKKKKKIKSPAAGNNEDDLVMEILRLREGQREMEDVLQGMNKRLETKERRPDQMMAFLNRVVVEDPNITKMLQSHKDPTRKRPRFFNSTTSVKSEEEAHEGMVSSSSPESGFGCSTPPSIYRSSSSSSSSPEQSMGGIGCSMVSYGYPIKFPPVEIRGSTTTAGQIESMGEMATGPPPYPFSLFGGGF